MPDTPIAIEMKSYYSFGLCFRSMLDLPELPLAPMTQAPDINIRIGPVPVDLPKASEREFHFQFAPGELLITVPEVARYRIIDGREIIIDPAPGATPANIRMPLYAVVLGALFHLRGLFPLHSSAIETEGGCLAFAGGSGAGKSTLVTYLQEQGFPVVADDICLITDPHSSGLQVLPGVPTIKLWQEALAIFGKKAKDYQQISDAVEKYKIPPERLSARKVLPLLGIVQIGRTEAAHTGAEQSAPFQRLKGLKAAEVILEETYWNYFVAKTGRTVHHFHAAANIANQIPIYRCRMPKTWARMQAVEALIQQQFGD